MTANQLRYLELQETKRANLAKEEVNAGTLSESIRHNTASEMETKRHNEMTESYTIASNAEVARHNRANEKEAERANLAREKETRRHNVSTELNASAQTTNQLWGINSSRSLAQNELAYKYANLANAREATQEQIRASQATTSELVRHNLATESIQQGQVAVGRTQAQAALQSAAASNLSAQAAMKQADTQDYLKESVETKNKADAALKDTQKYSERYERDLTSARVKQIEDQTDISWINTLNPFNIVGGLFKNIK